MLGPDFIQETGSAPGREVVSRVERRRAAALSVAPGRKLTGYAAVFGQETRIANFTEVIKPGAFTDTLHEISVVHAWPAYQGTSVEPRARRPHLEAALLFLETI